MPMQRGDLTPQRIQHYIEAHYANPITPRDVAAALNYSLCHLTHVTRRTLGCSLGDLLLKTRIEKARQLLERTALPVSRIASRVGFTDLAYFSRRFSQEMGASPTRWRKTRGPGGQPPHVCHACGRAMPSIPAAQEDGPDALTDAAS